MNTRIVRRSQKWREMIANSSKLIWQKDPPQKATRTQKKAKCGHRVTFENVGRHLAIQTGRAWTPEGQQMAQRASSSIGVLQNTAPRKVLGEGGRGLDGVPLPLDMLARGSLKSCF